MKIYKIGLVGALAATLVTSSVQSAHAVRNLPCSSVAYGCTLYGYAGHDPYNYDGSSKPNPSGYLHNCTSYVAFVLSKSTAYDARFGKLGNAIEWAVNAKALGFAVDQAPENWKIAHWNSGHVGLVEDVVLTSTGKVSYIIISADNLAANTVANKYYPGSSNWPDHFIDLMSLYSGGGGGGGGRMTFQRIQLPTSS